MSRGMGTSIALISLAGASELLVFSNGEGPIRIVLLLVFLLFAPGWAILRVAGLEMALSTRIGMAVALSAGVDMATASLLLYLGAWSAGLALTIVGAFVSAAALFGLPAARHSAMIMARRARAALSELGGQEPEADS